MKATLSDSRGATRRVACRTLGDARDEPAVHRAGLRGGLLGHDPDLFEGAGGGDDEVMGHQVVVLEDDLDGLARLDDDPVLVEQHLVGHGPHPDHPDAQDAQLLADLPPLVAGQEGGERVGELQGVERGGRRAVGGGDRPDVGHQAVQERPGLVGGPVRRRDALEGADGDGPVFAGLDEPREHLERRPFLTPDGRQRGHRRARIRPSGPPPPTAKATLSGGAGCPLRSKTTLRPPSRTRSVNLSSRPLRPSARL